MTKKPPFTRQTLTEYPYFKALADELKDRFLYLFDEKQLNNTGNLKRPSSSFLFYLHDCLLQISDECKATPGSKATGHLQQKDIWPWASDKWEKLSIEKKERYRLQADAAVKEMLKNFRYYQHKPIEDVWWEALNADGQKRFYFETAVRICKYLVYKSGWQGYLVIQNWAQLPEHAHYVDQDKLSELKKKKAEATRQADPGSSNQATASARSHQQGSHPYKDARKSKKPKQKKGKLVHLGHRVPGGPEQTLEPPVPQSQGAVAPVYTEVEIPLGAPPDIVEKIKISEGSMPQNASILWDYTKPGYISASSPHTTVAQPAPAHDPIHQQPLPSYYSPPAFPAYSPPTWSSIASSSSLASKVSSTIPLQTGLTNDAYGASDSNYPSYNFTAQSNMAASTGSGLSLPPHGQAPAMGYIPNYSPPHAWGASTSAGASYGYGALDDYSMATNIDAQYSWPPAQPNYAAPHAQTMFDSSPIGQMSQELQEYFDQTLYEHAGFWTF